MKLLLACVNTNLSLVGYDWDKGEIFWTCPQKLIRVCGAGYHGNDLLLSGDSFITRVMPDRYVRTELKGRHEALAHSVHVIDELSVGVVDTGNSRVVVLNRNGEIEKTYEPIRSWGDDLQDAIHLNDFAVTPHGILGSCFDYRPWREAREQTSWEDWCSGGYGLVLNVTGSGGHGEGRVVGCGFNHPHSLKYIEPDLYLCSSATGIFHVCEFNGDSLLREKAQYRVTEDHFLRGACHADGGWYLGGSSTRHGEVLSDTMEIYFLEEASGRVEKRIIEGGGEIYDILPWREEILEPIVERHFSNVLPYS